VVEFRLLGAVVALVDDRVIDLGPARQRCVLAALAVDANRVVSVDQLTRRLWGGDPPHRAQATLVNYLSRLRQLLAAVDAVTVVRRQGGYSLDVEQSAIDLFRFRDLCTRARAADERQAVRLLEEALALWRGEALTGLSGDWATAERNRLHQERVNAESDLADALLRLGQGEDLVAGLSARVTEWPLDERVAGQFMLALHRAGRTADALAHYRRLRERLVEELGTDPGEALQALHQQILAADPALTAVRAGTAVEAVVVPRQLPAVPAPFVGRRDELARLDAALHDTAATTVAISVIAGAGGIGKTWLALHWAHRHAKEFPDGQLFVDLRGFSPDSAPMDPAVAVRGFLTALGVESGRVPVDPHAQVTLFRSLVADKRILLVLDNAATTAQVAPLLPGGAACAVVITSRHRLSGLITGHSARHVALDSLSDTEAHALVVDRLDPARIAAEPAAVRDLIRFCGGFPLALTIVAGHATIRPQLPLALLAAELDDLGLDALDDTDAAASLVTVLSWSYRALTADQQQVFALLGTAPGPDIDLPAAASLTGMPPRETRMVLHRLEQASLITQDAGGRYRMHDLIRRYAAATAHDLPFEARQAALRRILDFYLYTAHAADRLLTPHRPSIPFDPPAPGIRSHPIPDATAALAWFELEHPNLLAAQRCAASHGRHRTVWQLAWTLASFHMLRGHRHDQLAVWQTVLDAGDHLTDPAVGMIAHRLIGGVHADLGHHGEAIGHLHQALALSEDHHNGTEQAKILHTLGWAWARQGDHQQAMDHVVKALDLYRAHEQQTWEAEALNNLGWYAACLGDHDTARTHCEAALTLFRRHRSLNGMANSLGNLGYTAHQVGHHTEALDYYRQSLALLREAGNIPYEALALTWMGQTYTALGQAGHARAAWREAQELYRQQGRQDDVARVQQQLDTLNDTDNDQHAAFAT
jgi:DNA-binding SARP family transcriptional activator/Flp pilus assembly protein TadD